jgi:hypothetical protein
VGQHYELKEKHSLYLYNYLDFPSRLRILCLIILIFNSSSIAGAATLPRLQSTSTRTTRSKERTAILADNILSVS